MQERSRILFRFADLIDKHTEELAVLESLVRPYPCSGCNFGQSWYGMMLVVGAVSYDVGIRCVRSWFCCSVQDNGKPFSVSKSVDIPFSAEHIRYFAG